ncbi:hypothetical protein PpBr36_04148 [Pyricularia pennisetigena]|uniref:hypothetical protein n=1 Tax=Pyricularia pennisetigena TaxID=1578925 RepID=UPI00114D75BE|nr:hypothetical protein PpBr36_04148 [Pyricularia pennisetigena]TLS27530.1 hypothetical protein PpBr36_04148 [Pyricularia pennisetigena]
MSTLDLAAGCQRSGVFRYLIRAGAKLDDPDLVFETWCRLPANMTQEAATSRDMLVTYLDHPHHPGATHKLYFLLLARVVKRCTTSPDQYWWKVMERLVNSSYVRRDYAALSLAVAVEGRCVRLVKFLLEKDAEVHGTVALRDLLKDEVQLRDSDILVPVFKATLAMARSRDPDLTKEIEIMDLLLRYGAKINTWMPCYSVHHGYKRRITRATPLLIFLRAIEERGEPLQNTPGIKKAVDYLLEKGASCVALASPGPLSVEQEGLDETSRRLSRMISGTADMTDPPFPDAAETILFERLMKDRRFLADPAYAYVIKSIVGRYSFDDIEYLSKILAAADLPEDTDPVVREHCLEAWGSILDAVFGGKTAKELNRLLYFYALLKATCCLWPRRRGPRVVYHVPTCHLAPGLLAKATISRLASTPGVDINARLYRDGPTLLVLVEQWASTSIDCWHSRGRVCDFYTESWIPGHCECLDLAERADNLKTKKEFLDFLTKECNAKLKTDQARTPEHLETGPKDGTGEEKVLFGEEDGSRMRDELQAFLEAHPSWSDTKASG